MSESDELKMDVEGNGRGLLKVLFRDIARGNQC
jgi:hypothetical protein